MASRNDALPFSSDVALGRNLAGALTAAVVSFSIAVPVGALTTAPLGPAYAGFGAMAGMISAAIGGLVAALAGSTGVLRSGPITAACLVVSALVAHLVAARVPAHDALVLAMLCTASGGALQLAFGVARVGYAIKFVPRPVLAGFRSGVALVIALSQLPALLGVLPQGPFRFALVDLSVVVGFATIAAVMIVRRTRFAYTALFVALVAGTVLDAWLSGMNLGTRRMGAMPPLSALPDFADLWSAPSRFLALGHGSSLALSAFSLALVSSLLSLLAAKMVEDLTGTRADGNRELVAQGLGNLASAALGGTPLAGAPAITSASYRAGTRSRWSVIVTTVLLGAVILAGSRVVSMIPLAAIAGVMMVIAWDMLDPELLRYLRDVPQRRRLGMEAWVDPAIVGAVAMLSVFVNIVAGVAAGVLISVAVFVAKSSRSVVRRHATAAERRSGRQRNAAEMELLKHVGRTVAILELQGPIFFGTADALAGDIQGRTREARQVILDFSRVNAVDATGAHVIGRLAADMKRENRRLLLCSLPRDDRRRAVLERDCPADAVQWCIDLDRALERCEDELLGTDATRSVEMPFESLDLCRDMSAGECRLLRETMAREVHGAGTVLFREGDRGDCLYVLARGSVTITLSHARGAIENKRIATFAPGVIFGEMAVLDGSPRSADATFDVDSVLYRLSQSALDALHRTHPELAVKIYVALAKTLATRLRSTTQEVRLLAAQ